MSNIAKKTITVALTGVLALSGMLALSGCDAVKGVVGSTDIGKKALSSENTKTADRAERFAYVEDIDGNEYTTVIKLVPPNDKHFDVNKAKQIFTDNDIRWYQLIASDAMGTNTQEYGMLYFPASVTLADLQKAQEQLSATYDAHIMNCAEYDEYLAEAPTDEVWDIQLYGHEITYYGPAAQQQ